MTNSSYYIHLKYIPKWCATTELGRNCICLLRARYEWMNMVSLQSRRLDKDNSIVVVWDTWILSSFSDKLPIFTWRHIVHGMHDRRFVVSHKNVTLTKASIERVLFLPMVISLINITFHIWNSEFHQYTTRIPQINSTVSF